MGHAAAGYLPVTTRRLAGTGRCDPRSIPSPSGASTGTALATATGAGPKRLLDWAGPRPPLARDRQGHRRPSAGGDRHVAKSYYYYYYYYYYYFVDCPRDRLNPEAMRATRRQRTMERIMAQQMVLVVQDQISPVERLDTLYKRAIRRPRAPRVNEQRCRCREQ
ncbi:MAG: hypothetical protein AB1486_10930 [Planctomycetota bacterium]